MRYFLDPEYNGIGGEPLSLALVPDDGDELYLTLRNSDPPLDWVERHVVPFMFPVTEAGQLEIDAFRQYNQAHGKRFRRYLLDDMALYIPVLASSS